MGSSVSSTTTKRPSNTGAGASARAGAKSYVQLLQQPGDQEILINQQQPDATETKQQPPPRQPRPVVAAAGSLQVDLDERLALELQAEAYHAQVQAQVPQQPQQAQSTASMAISPPPQDVVEAAIAVAAETFVVVMRKVLVEREQQVADTKTRFSGESPFCRAQLSCASVKLTTDHPSATTLFRETKVKDRAELDMYYVLPMLVARQSGRAAVEAKHPVPAAIDWTRDKYRLAWAKALVAHGIFCLRDTAKSHLEPQGTLGLVIAHQATVVTMGSAMGWPDTAVPMAADACLLDDVRATTTLDTIFQSDLDKAIAESRAAAFGDDAAPPSAGGAGDGAMTSSASAAGAGAEEEPGTFAILPEPSVDAGTASTKSGECSICRKDLLSNKPVALVPCGHMACFSCETQLKDRTRCFACRKPVTKVLSLFAI